jgi:hypothetical protein
MRGLQIFRGGLDVPRQTLANDLQIVAVTQPSGGLRDRQRQFEVMTAFAAGGARVMDIHGGRMIFPL